MACGPLENSFKRASFDENGPLGNDFQHLEKINKTFLQGNKIEKLIEEDVWTK